MKWWYKFYFNIDKKTQFPDSSFDSTVVTALPAPKQDLFASKTAVMEENSLLFIVEVFVDSRITDVYDLIYFRK